MSHRCRHGRVEDHDTGFSHALRCDHPNPAAHGNIMRHEMCMTCGAERVSNVSGSQVETTGWKGGRSADALRKEGSK